VDPAGERCGFTEVLERMRHAVRAVAAADPDPTDPYRGLYVSDEQALLLGTGAPSVELERRFDSVCDRLGLDELARSVLAICVAPEAHSDCARILGYLHDDLSRGSASPRLVARLIAGVAERDVLACFDERAVLRATGAIRIEGRGPLADRGVTVGAQLARELLGANVGDDTAGGRLRRVDCVGLPEGRHETVQRLRSLLEQPRQLPLAVSGPDALELLVAATCRSVVLLDACSALEPDACDDLALAVALDGGLAVVDGIGELARDGRDRALRRIFALPCRPVLLVADREDELALADQALLAVRVPTMTPREQEAAWRAAVGAQDLHGVAARFRLDLRQIAEAAAIARAETRLRGMREADAGLLALAARTVSSRRVRELASLLEPGPSWDSLVLPPRQLAALRSLSSYLRHREQVMDRWGFAANATGWGLTAMFAGESGTGKTLAARVVGGAAGLDVYRVDLAGLFSKWVGETEKNLDRIFGAASDSNAVLFFDEADVVFSRRSAVTDASDRYANLETAYLLQRIEAYDGIVVLATNLRSNIDNAFLRRLDIVIEFPTPAAPTRRQLWSTLLPSGAPLTGDIDLDFLAERFELTGGGIRNCTMSAAFLAADDGGVIGMTHLVRAVALEYAKLGRLTLEADFERFHSLVREPLAPPR
jgi:hypothetical protein